ncbi:MAG: glycosyltransferase [Lachnospiraceae bacterium]|nr:glycosyltransferase [Lachnospiraceae bacterium]
MGDILLTISLLTGGTRPELTKCIRSLDHLRAALPCELIITDTGCDKAHRELIESEADRVLDFTWVNDFAAARNVSLEAARGQWYLYLDDDEWFEGTAEIEHFFKSGEYKDAQRAGYRQRNYSDMSGVKYEDTYVGRMTAMLPGIHFHGKIHEFLDTPAYTDGGECPLLNDFVHHYGYVQGLSGTGQNRQARNIPLLIEMISEEPDCDRWYYQLLLDYAVLRDTEGVEKVSRMALETIPYKEMYPKFYHSFVIAVLDGYLRRIKDENNVNLGNDLMAAFSFLMTALARTDTFGDGSGFYEGKISLYGALFSMAADDRENTIGFCHRYYRSVLKTGIVEERVKAAAEEENYISIKKLLNEESVQRQFQEMAVYFGSRYTDDAFSPGVSAMIADAEDWAGE